MEEEFWHEVEKVFYEATQIEPTLRRDYLDRVCAGRELLKREVESLLASAEEDDSFLDPL